MVSTFIFLSTRKERKDMEMGDPTYVKAEIDKKLEWKLAFTLSEIQNDNAPIGWGKYIPVAKRILAIYDVKERKG